VAQDVGGGDGEEEGEEDGVDLRGLAAGGVEGEG
jgi:hypothetical protein